MSVITADFEMECKNKGIVTVYVSCSDIIGDETKDLCIQFYDDTMTSINYGYNKEFLAGIEKKAIIYLTDAKKILVEEEMERCYNWHGGER